MVPQKYIYSVLSWECFTSNSSECQGCGDKNGIRTHKAKCKSIPHEYDGSALFMGPFYVEHADGSRFHE